MAHVRTNAGSRDFVPRLAAPGACGRCGPGVCDDGARAVAAAGLAPRARRRRGGQRVRCRRGRRVGRGGRLLRTAGAHPRRAAARQRRDPRRTTPHSVTFAATPDTTGPGRYGVWLDGGLGHARVGQAAAARMRATVTRELVAVDRGELAPGPARWNQYYYWDRPSVSLGLPDEDVSVLSDVGGLPGWVVRPEPGRPATGRLGRARPRPRSPQGGDAPRRPGAAAGGLDEPRRRLPQRPRRPAGARRALQPRPVGVARRRGGDGVCRVARCAAHRPPRVVDGGSHRAAGARPVTARRPRRRGVPRLARCSTGASCCATTPTLHRVPGPLVRMATDLMGSRGSRRLVGVHEPIDVARTDWVARADELTRPMLVIHRDGDDFVPIGPAVALAGTATRPRALRAVGDRAALPGVERRPAALGARAGRVPQRRVTPPAEQRAVLLQQGVQLEVDARRRDRPAVAGGRPRRGSGRR